MAKFKGLEHEDPKMQPMVFVTGKGTGNYKWKPIYTKVLVYKQRGWGNIDTATALNISRRTVDEIVRRPDFIDKFNRLQQQTIDKARRLIEAHVLDAAQKIIELSQEGVAAQKIQFEAAKEILYMVGMKPIEVVETRKREYTPEELTSSLETVKELEKIGDRLIKRDTKFLLATQTTHVSASQPPSLPPVPATRPTAEEEIVVEAKETGDNAASRR